MATSTERLAPITWPVLGIFGDQDQAIPVEMVRAFESSLNALGVESEVYIYPGVGPAHDEELHTTGQDLLKPHQMSDDRFKGPHGVASAGDEHGPSRRVKLEPLHQGWSIEGGTASACDGNAQDVQPFRRDAALLGRRGRLAGRADVRVG